jgi:serine/threonine protein kinase
MPLEIKGRYEVRQVLGQGGMGVVYHAYDKVVRRSVALKTIRDSPSRTALDLFYKECDVLAHLSHPNIVEIFDLGEFEEDGASKPYFVMPLLPGKTLDHLIRNSSGRLTVQRAVEIICQTCRGLQAAHDSGLVHRDLKPSNIFVMEDDSVKIIDFGIAHMAETHSTLGHKGTLLYMAPEQVEMKPASALSDIFSLGVVCFETLTLRHPFERSNAGDVAGAILKHIPPPASEFNPSVNTMLSRVVHKAMAKQPWYRFSSAREMAEALQKASRNEPIEMFDPARIQPRVERARKAFDSGDHQFANEILSELEAEGHVDASIASLRRQIDQFQREKSIAQLLESARTRAEEEEFPLAFQKLQELLTLDPTNAPGLALKSSIEKRRSERKIEDWLRLAHQHLGQHAFELARQALKNVLQLNSLDSRALQLMGDIDRREQEFLRSRQEKEQLYNNAVEAWRSGEVSAALSKLERLVEMDQRSPDTGERSAAFQTFYNQVRTEHDTIKAAYEQARKHLVDRNFAAALEICDEQLSRHPGQALFQALKLEIEERNRQDLSSRIAEVDRRVEAEPDLEKRVAILSEALQLCPGEPHFERALRTMRDKRDLVNSIVSKAQSFEGRQQFGEAVAQWEILKTIYSQYPGLDFEIERVRRRHNQQLRSEAKVRCVEQIDWQLSAGNFQRAKELLAQASAEFPGDEELAALDSLAAQGIARAAEAQRLLAQGQALCAECRFAEGIPLLRQAQEFDPGNLAVRAALTGTLVEQARAELEQNWQSAGDLAQQALDLDPANTQAKSLKALALDRRREESVNRCVAQARRLQADGQIEAALHHVEQALADFPRETRLTQLRNTLTKAYTETQRSRAAGGTETVAMPQAAPQPAPPPAPRPGAVSAPALPVDLSAETVALSPAGPAPIAQTVALSPAPSSSAPPTVKTAPIQPPPPAAQSKSAAAPQTHPFPGPRRKTPKALIAAAGAALVLLAMVGGVFALRKSKAPAPLPPVRSVPIAPVAAPVEPAATSLRLVADIEGGKAVLDQDPPRDLADGQLSLDNLAAGNHTLKVTGAREEADLEFEITPGSAPAITALHAKEAIAVVVSSMAGSAQVHTSGGPSKVSVDGAPAGETSAGALALTGLSPGNHDLAIGEGKDLRTMVLSVGPAPTLSAFLKSDRNVGALVIVTGEDGVHVFLNGKEYRRQTQRGQLRIPNLDVKDYDVSVAKDGFQDSPDQHASVRKGEEAKLEFKLQPVPRVASLAIQGGTPGSDVLLDQNPIGQVQDDGTFTASSVPPGDHAIELHKEGYRPKKVQRHFTAGAAVQLAAADTALDKALSTLKLHVTPPDARVTINRTGEAPKPITDSTLSLPDGSYILTAHAANYADRSLTVALSGGETKAVELTLAKIPAPAAVTHQGMAVWDDPAAWVEQNGWYVRKGGNFVPLKPARTSGVIVFTAELRKGKRLQWVAAHTDPQNYVLFQIDRKSFYRAEVVGGKEKQLEKKPYAGQKENAFTIEVDITPGSIVNKFFDGAKWAVLDTWQDPARAFSTGKFGLLLPGSDTVALSNFSFTPQ